MSHTYANANIKYQSELDAYTNPRHRQIAEERIRLYGSINAMNRSIYGGSNNKSTSNHCSSDSIGASSNGKYMIHCYYGCQPGNKVTTVIG
jgi:hypothetical protein